MKTIIAGALLAIVMTAMTTGIAAQKPQSDVRVGQGQRQITIPGGQATDPLAKVPRITLEDLKALIAKGENAVLILDVRGPESYEGGHIPGAILMPIGTENAHLDELKATKQPIVTYCS